MRITNRAYNLDDILMDNQVIERILEGETELFEVLMRRHNQLLFRTIRSYFREEADVEDIMQDTYIKVFEKLHQFNKEAQFTTWLVRIGINEALQRKRKLKKHNGLRYIGTEDKEIFQIPDTTTMNPEIKSKVINPALFIENAIEGLPEKYRIVYMLKEVEGMEVAEVAASLQLSNSNVKIRLHRARKMLKNSLLQVAAKSDLFEFGNEKCDRMVDTVLQLITFKTR